LNGQDMPRRWVIGLYGSAIFLFWISLYLYVPTLSVYIQERTGELAVVGTILSMFGLWQAIIRLPLGILSDWVGRRKPFIIGGLAFSLLGALLLGTSSRFAGLLAGRALTGIAAGAWVPLVVAFSALFPRREAVRATSLLLVLNSSGRMLATGANGWLNSMGGYQLAFAAAAGAAALSLLFLLPAPERRTQPKPPHLSRIAHLAGRREVLLPSLVSAVAQFSAWTSVFTFTPILARRLGASDGVLSAMMSLNIAMVVIGGLVVTILVKRSGPKPLLYLAFILIAVGISAAGLAHNLTMIIISQIANGLAAGLSHSILMGLSIERVNEEERSTAMGLHQSIFALGVFTGPWLSGLLADAIGLRPMFAVVAAATLLTGVLGTRWLKVEG
jgi:MFS family permease